MVCLANTNQLYFWPSANEHSILHINVLWLISLQWRHNGRDSVSNQQRHDCSLNRLFRRRSKKTSKLRVTGRCAGNSPGTVEFPAQMASYAENVSIWWRHHGNFVCLYLGRLRHHKPKMKLAWKSYYPNTFIQLPFLDGILKCSFLTETFNTLIYIPLKYVPRSPFDN